MSFVPYRDRGSLIWRDPSGWFCRTFEKCSGPSIVASRVVGSLFKTRSSTTLRLGAHSHDAMLATVRAAQIAPVADSNRASGRHRSRRWPTHVAHLADSDFFRRKPEQGSHQISSPGGRTRRGKTYRVIHGVILGDPPPPPRTPPGSFESSSREPFQE